jgi:error-prone DNA polymerase
MRHDEGLQMALPLEPPQAPELKPLDDWERVVADYRSTGMTLDEHPMGLLRDELGAEVLRSSDLQKVDDGGTVEVAGMVVARQRPETAKGIVFMLLEDERGTVNLIVPSSVYERCRAAVRAAPLVRASGKLERREGTVNVLVSEVKDLDPAPTRRRRAEKRSISSLSGPSAEEAPVRLRAVEELRAVAPAGHSFGRR